MHIFSTISDSQLGAQLLAGAVGVLPTDTVYGLAARAANPEAVTKLYALKRREHKPGTLIAADVTQLVTLGLDEQELLVMARYWPGPISAIIAANDRLMYVHQGVGSLAVRIPADADLRALLKQTGPLVTSSANAPGEPPATDLAEAKAYFSDQVDFYVDGGHRVGLPSTIVRVQNGAVEILRQGAAKLMEGKHNDL